MFAQQWRAEWDTWHISAKQPKVKGNKYRATTLFVVACVLLTHDAERSFLQLAMLLLSQRLLLSLSTEIGNTYARKRLKLALMWNVFLLFFATNKKVVFNK